MHCSTESEIISLDAGLRFDGLPALDLRKTKYACIVNADESMRTRLEDVPHSYHEDHNSAKKINSFTRYTLVHKFIPMPQAFKIPDAMTAVEK